MQGSKGETDVKNRLLDSVREGECGVIWENSIEIYVLLYVKLMTSASSMQETGHPKPVLCDNLERQDVEGGDCNLFLFFKY